MTLLRYLLLRLCMKQAAFWLACGEAVAGVRKQKGKQ